MAYFLFVLVNAALFIRPAEIVPALLGWEIYFYLILACSAAAAPDVLKHLTEESLDKKPITLCVFALLPAILLPATLAGDLAEGWRTGFHFAKIIVYYLLFVSLVNTTLRLRILLICILAFSGVITSLAVLRYHDIIQLATIQTLADTTQGMYGTTITVQRLQGTGIFQDPNELCVLLSAMVPLALYFLLTSENLYLRGVCATLLPLFAYAVFLTGSRGGFLAFAGGLGAFVWLRYGWRQAMLIGAVGLPALLFLFAGRQTEISTSTGTAQTRVELWREWLTTWRENMLFGKGMNLPKDEVPDPLKYKTDEERQHAAHNSYLQGFADLGLFGGCLWIGAFVTAFWSLYRFADPDPLWLDDELKGMHAYLLAGLAAYGIGMLSLSICFIVPTYMMLGLAVAYVGAAQRSAVLPPTPLHFDMPLVARFLVAGAVALTSIYVFVRFVA
ncbi:MAG: O-antigen ligase family protein [Planctomycetes bacterium]|nr:O-antigen ligase family protein [Planctomycetota bacterium]